MYARAKIERFINPQADTPTMAYDTCPVHNKTDCGKCPECGETLNSDGMHTVWCPECGYEWVSDDPEPFDIGEVW